MSFRSSQGRVVATLIALIFFVVILHKNAGQESFISSIAIPQRGRSPKYPTLRERMELSEKSWKTSVELRQQMVDAHPNSPQIPLFPAQSVEAFVKYPYTLWDFFPATWSCPHDIQRIGRLGDGGKWVCGMSIYETIPAPSSWKSKIPSGGQDGVVVYSFGINGESSFEAEMLERIPSARIWGFDFSVSGWGKQIASAHRKRTFFQRVGIGKAYTPSSQPPLFTLQYLMSQNNHTYIDILKIDVEGAEYDSLDAVMEHFSQVWKGEGDAVLPIGQVMIELHVGDDRPEINFKRFRGWWENLEKMGLRPAWMEMNLMAVTIPEGKSDPRCTEYVLVNAKDPRSVLWR